MRPNKYILFLLATLVAFVAFEYYKPKPIDWRPTYQNNDKIPFGTQAMFELLPSLMRQPAVETTRLPAYNLLTETKLPPRSNYIAVCETFAAGEYDTRELLRYVARGNTAFLSAYSFSDTLSRALGFKAEVKNPLKADTTLRSNFVGPALARKGGYNFRHDDGRNFLVVKKPNTAITVLARNARKEAVFLRIPHGKGVFYIHNLPLALTNYYLLAPASSDYMTKALSYLPAQPTYWDEFQKQGRFDEDEQSLLRYIYKQPALSWAYYIGLFGLIIYALFAGKRTQRIIPVMQLPQNTSLEFVKTVGRMYFQQNDHDNVARKKIQYFLADLRERYFLNTQVLNSEFTETLARKSGVPLEETQNLVRMLAQANRAVSLSEFDLLTINATIENFNAAAASKV
ncbi:DUF4350 domain-containing protein [Fibrella forsythiae]|uniref:DUF4350 domain-containing protein n=1 Tax=Fibrella forsythiae TaxID=2817061 RepID=A0ABS3JFX4_9BACT|nr:DUF4350 domain-containing protein [Fibrella forsythiae]MBO0948906.1 DUF4350 domain-containing protein [Fibrella forsythiae]